MTRRMCFVALMIGTLSMTGCITMTVSSYLQPGTNLSQYHTWAWGPADNFPTGDPRLDNNTIFKNRLEAALEKSLAIHRLERAAVAGNADVLIHYHANISQRFSVEPPDANCGPNCKPSVMDYDEGSLVIDLVDARTDKLIWRGWSKDSVQGVIDDQAYMERKINEAIGKIMATFPL